MIAAVWAWLSSSALGRRVLAVAAMLLAVGGVLFLGRQQGRDQQRREERAKEHDAYRDAVATRSQIEDRVRRSGDGTASDELRRDWSHD